MIKPHVSLFGAANISNIVACNDFFKKNNVSVTFYEQKNYFNTLSEEGKKIVICTDQMPKTELTFTFNEFWISRLLKKRTNNYISKDPLIASRSKMYLSDLLNNCNIVNVNRTLLSHDSIIPAGTIVRPDCGYSGRGVKYCLEDIRFADIFQFIYQECSETMKKIMGQQQVKLVMEPFINGREYSCDVIVCPRGIKILRLCLKYVIWLNSCPCTIAYFTLDANEEITVSIEKWSKAIFADTDYSFAQFDFIQNERGDFFLIDFASRTGGGLLDLLRHAAPQELHASAICYALNVEPSIFCVRPNYAQYNILPQMSDYANAVCRNSHSAEYIPSQNQISETAQISSANARIATLIRQEKSISDFYACCMEYVKVLSKYYFITTPLSSKKKRTHSVIDNDDAKKFISSLHNHNILSDTLFLLNYIKKLSPKKILDVGFGSGKLIQALSNFDVEIFGIEKSVILFQTLKSIYINNSKIKLFNSDLQDWISTNKFDTIVFSFVLHHVDNPWDVLERYCSMLEPNGSLVIVDRVAQSIADKNYFPVFWNSTYKQQHEWEEDCPNIVTKEEYNIFFSKHDFTVQYYKFPHDNKEGVSGFPKTLILACKTKPNNITIATYPPSQPHGEGESRGVFFEGEMCKR